jgi:transcription-repair coupling factor (superfamily II helicase)
MGHWPNTYITNPNIYRGLIITPDISKNLDQGTEVNLRVPALIPDDYLPDVNGRLILYKRIAAATSNDELRSLQVEMIDRFGLLPEQVKVLFSITELKQQADKIGIKKIEKT